MNNLVEHIVDKEYEKANEIFESKIDNILVQKLNEAKKMVAAKMCEQIPAFMGAAAGNAVKLRRGVLEEDDIEEALDPSEKTELSVEKGTPKPKPGSTHYKNVQEEDQLDEARIGIVKARIRGGKIERRKKVSGVEGYKLQDGKLKRMSPAERRRRKLGQKRGKLKRKAKLRQALMKRKRSLRKRASIGL